LEVENKFALEYDEKELAGAATVSAMLWENGHAVNLIRTFIMGSTEPVNILDLGCGTGRFEELLLTDPVLNKKIGSIVAVDFAPNYLVRARERLEHFLSSSELKKIVFLRRIAEDLQLPTDHFDVVIAGFGIVCFSQSHSTLREAYRVLRDGGLLVTTGYNRSALTFEFNESMRKAIGRSASHFAIEIDRNKNIMYLSKELHIHCYTFDLSDVLSLVTLIGFQPMDDSVRTFPTLYGSARKEYLLALSSNNRPARGKEGEKHATCLKRKNCGAYASYQEANLKRDRFDSGFNEIIHNMDRDLEGLFGDKGFYFCFGAHKKVKA
jgi:ubiquinone/menaquinone biosynthesis C-methylase UbiE